jgi:hypothetical protein
MRIKGPGEGARPPEAVDEAANINAPDELAPAEAGEVAAVGKAGATSGAAAADPVAAVAAQLRAGQIDVDRAVDLLIDDAVNRQLGHAVSTSLAPELRKLLRDYAANDPMLAARIRRLTQSK